MTNFHDAFEGMTKQEIDEFFQLNQFQAWRQLETGEWIGLYRLTFTLSVCMDVTPYSSYAYRWCFEDHNEAAIFFAQAVEYDEVPTQRNSLKGHRYRTAPLLIEKNELGFDKW